MKMIIDTDPGVDDVIAIALAHAMPDIELVGLTTIFGNTFVGQSSRNARYLAGLLGADVPVAQGASLPYGEATYEPAPHVHGPEGFGDIIDVPEIGANIDETAAAFLVRMARENKGELVVCAIGPLTNIADALRLDDSFASNLKELVLMGGAFEHAGNITEHAEANIFHDARAADEVFASDLEIKMVGLNATMQTLMKSDDFIALAKESPKIGGFISRITPFYLQFYRDVVNADGCAMHDAAAVLCCTNPERFDFHRSGLRVSLDEANYGATIADENRKPVAIAMNIDAPWALSTLKTEISRLD
ncbi:nucleoside hydrolase [Ahrensia sp. 13_GOM-1096m]|uniref:nucleoside hydrolase n=1 Tax=Ahrensia sp. 13_GOM-1096m TaxID=1380380 RepID=UPI0005580FE8|nr:nucleoside hydrolase [Ahrensia sp. 13_GOM-1096m]